MIMHSHTTLIPILFASILAMSPTADAATAQVGVSAFAADSPSGVPFLKNQNGSLATGFSFASRTVDAIAGKSSSHADAEADALNGTLRAKVSAEVAADRFVIGRNSGSTAVASMSGAITLAGPALPGLATFSAILEGKYSVLTPAPFNFQSIDNHVEVTYALHLGSSPEFNDNLFFFCCGPGNFVIPFSWTQPVNSGDIISFSLFLDVRAFTVAGGADLDLSNTFKITGVDLPAGLGFTPDSPGFLAQFEPVTTVPVPAAIWLFGSALSGLVCATRRERSRNLTKPDSEIS
jgi:hypothetical protein